MTRAVNPQTGEVVELVGGQWVKVPGREVAAAKAQEGPREKLMSGTGEAILVGAGDALTTMGRNARGLLASVTGNDEAQGRIAAETQEAAELRSRMREEAPIASAIGGALPGLATLPLGLGIGGAGMLAGNVGRIGTQVALGAGQGALASETGDMGAGAAEGGALAGVGMLGANMIQRVRAGRAAAAGARALPSRLTTAEADLVEGARRSGMQVTPGQALNDPTMRQLEASMSSNPMLSQHWQQIKADNSRQLSTLAARAMGENADNVGPAVRAAAESRLGDEFADIGRRIGKVDTAPLKKRLGELANDESTALLPRMELEAIVSRFSRGEGARRLATPGAALDEVTGEALMRERSKVSKQMRDAYTKGDSTLGELYGDVIDAMDDSVRRSASRGVLSEAEGLDVARAYDQARDQWSVLRGIERGGASIDGNVMPGRMAQIMSQSDKTGFVGRAARENGEKVARSAQLTGSNLNRPDLGNFYDALRFSSSQLGKDIVGDSGTATRLALGNMFEGGLVPTVGRLGGRVMGGPAARYYMGASPDAASAFIAAKNAAMVTQVGRAEAAATGALRGVPGAGE